MAADCADVEEPSSKMPGSNQTVTIGTSCTGRLEVTGDSNTIIIPNGVTISGDSSNDRHAIETTDGTNTNITVENGGTIAPERYGIVHDTGTGTIDNITVENGGTIQATETGGSRLGTAIWNKSTITNILNDGTIDSRTRNAIVNGAGGKIIKIHNQSNGLINSQGTWAIKNVAGGHIVEILNDGTIQTPNETAIRNYTNNGSASNSLIETINNSGTITSPKNTIQNEKDAEITNIINSGIIEATGTKGKAIRNTDSAEIGTINNSGTIRTTHNSSTSKGQTIWVTEGASIDNIINSGTISSLRGEGTISIGALGTITTITNTGTISSTGSGIDIFNKGTLGTLNNDQGGGDALTYSNTLPTNYNVIVNSASDFGKIVFSDVSGSTIFGISENSTLTEETTYSSIINGLSSSNVGGGTSGSFITASTRFDWALSNSSDNLWDLVVDEAVDIGDDTGGSVEKNVKPNIVTGINNMASVTNTNFANMNTYDCDLFGKSNFCFSPGGRYQIINTPNVKTSGIVFIGGYKLSDSLRVAGFLHRNFSHKTPKNYKIKDRTPMTGGLLVWNQNPDITGWQVKFASAAQRKTATLTRAVFGTSEEATGQTGIQAQSYVIETQYGYQFNEDVLLKPYLAVRRAMIEQDAYTEQGASTPLSYNEIKDQSTTLLLGLKYDAKLNQKLTVNGSVGVEYDTSHSLNKLTPTGISGLSTVSLTDGFNDVRPLASVGFDYEVMPNQKLSGTFQYQELAYKSKTESNAYLYYTIGI